MKDIQTATPVSISSKDLDVLCLRNNPADKIGHREWAQNAAYIFGQIAISNEMLNMAEVFKA